MMIYKVIDQYRTDYSNNSNNLIIFLDKEGSDAHYLEGNAYVSHRFFKFKVKNVYIPLFFRILIMPI